MITSIHAAMAKKREDIENDEQGFTLIELLVVILIIGILAAIAIPVFLGQQDQAKDAAARSDLANAKVTLISYATTNNGDYTDGDDLDNLKVHGYVTTDGVEDTAVTFGPDGAFCISAKSGTGTTFGVSDVTSKVAEGTCTAGVFAGPVAG